MLLFLTCAINCSLSIRLFPQHKKKKTLYFILISEQNKKKKTKNLFPDSHVPFQLAPVYSSLQQNFLKEFSVLSNLPSFILPITDPNQDFILKNCSYLAT